MQRSLLVVVLVIVCSSALNAASYVVPVVTAKIKDQTYSTTLAFLNESPLTDVTCEATYALPDDPKGGTLRATYKVPAGGQPLVEDDLLREVGAVGTLGLTCTGDVTIAARIHSSSDGGVTFDSGRTFAAIRESDAFHESLIVRPRKDLLVAEVAGNPVSIDAVVTTDDGILIAMRSYDIPAYAQQIVDLSTVRQQLSSPTVTILITAGGGAVAVQEETDDPDLLKMAVRMTDQSRREFGEQQSRQLPLQAAPGRSSSGSGATDMLLASAFKAAPFREPMTGLTLIRDRWYEPSTGSFLTPDPEGYLDSSNLYIFGKGDPVNNHDPTGRHTEVTRRVGHIDFNLQAPTPEELAKGQLGLYGTYVNPMTGLEESFTWDQHVSEMFLMQARSNPLMAESFEAFFGVTPDAIPTSTSRLYWNGLWEHKGDIALSTVLSLTAIAPAQQRAAAVPRTRVNMLQPRITPVPRTQQLVPGGGLIAHERAGGHTIARHVGQTHQQLEARLLAERGIKSASTFVMPATAETAVAEALAARQAQISSWLQGNAARLRLDYVAPRTTGFSVTRGTTQAMPVQGVRVILVRDAAMPTGYRIVTSFPQ